MPADNLTIDVNGRGETMPHGSTISEMLRLLSVDPSQPGIAVAVNESVVRRTDWAEHVVVDGDRIDVIQATQGG